MSADRRLAAGNLLIAALHPNASAFDTVAAEHGPAFDWDWLVERATWHKVTALLAARVLESRLSAHLAPDVRAKLEGLMRTGAARAAMARETLHRLTDTFDRHGIPFIVIKGSALAEPLYGDAALRPFYDVDVVAPFARMGDVERVMLALGYVLNRVTLARLRMHGIAAQGAPNDLASFDETRRFLLAHHHHLSFGAPAGLLPVEVHWRLAPEGLLRVSENALWDEAVRATIEGADVRTLGEAATFVHTAFHATSDLVDRFRLLHVADVVRLVERSRGAPDARVQPLSEAWGAAGEVACALCAARRVFGVSTGRMLEARLRRPWQPAAFAALGARRTLVEQRAPEGRAVRLAWQTATLALWDIAKARPPRAGWALAQQAVRQHLRKRPVGTPASEP